MNISELANIAGLQNIRENELLSRHTTLKIGGPARFFVIVNNEQVLKQLLDKLKSENQKYFLIGNGSNLLALDEGYDGVILKLSGDFENIELKDESSIEAGAAALLSKVSAFAANSSLKNMEFASGIPGTLGGALYMNAGAYEGEMKQIVRTVDVLEYNGREYVRKEILNEDMQFSYRHSIAKERDMIILGCTISLEKGDSAKIREKMDELNSKRREKQPLEYPSAGSTFKRPEGYFAGKLISDAGLKGYKVGGAEVSEKHAGFCINRDNAKAADFIQLMDDVSRKVYEQYGVELEPEVIILK